MLLIVTLFALSLVLNQWKCQSLDCYAEIGVGRAPQIVQETDTTGRTECQMIQDGSRGDINSDGKVNVLDIVAVIRILLGIQQPTPQELFLADCDGNGNIDVTDVSGIINVTLGTGTCIQGTMVYGKITSDAIWTLENSPFIVVDTVTVIQGVKLAVEPGVLVKFDTLNPLIVDGTLDAVGTKENMITFSLNGQFDFSKSYLWGGIKFTDNSTDCILMHSLIEYCHDQALWIENSSPTISYCSLGEVFTIGETRRAVIVCTGNSSPVLAYNLIEVLSGRNASGICCNPPSNPEISGNDILCGEGNLAVIGGGFLNGNYLEASDGSVDTTLGERVDQAGDGIFNTTSTFQLPLFMNVDGVTNPKSAPNISEQSKWISLGFEDKWALRLVLTDQHLYSCAGTYGLFRRSIADLSADWEYIGLADTSLGHYFNRGVSDLFVNPANNDILYVAYLSGKENGTGLYCSTDGGLLWVPGDSGIASCAAPHIGPYMGSKSSINGTLHASALILLVSGPGDLYKSVDGGFEWDLVWGTPSSGGFRLFDIEIHPNQSNVVWAVGETSRFAPIVLKSIDGGSEWEFLDLRKIVPVDNAFYSIAFDPIDPNMVYLGMQGAVIKSTDGGSTWIVPVLTHCQGAFFRALASDFNNHLHIYSAAGTTLAETWNGGETWKELSNNPISTQILSMVYDYKNRILYVGTEGGIFYYDPKRCSVEK